MNADQRPDSNRDDNGRTRGPPSFHEFRERIFHVHAKDTEIDRELLDQDGIPGYDVVVGIELEDRKFEGTEDLVKRGFYLSRNVLAPLMV